MAVSLLASLPNGTQILSGLSTDTKPTGSISGTPLIPGAKFFEYDTDTRYEYDGDSWNIDAVSGASVLTETSYAVLIVSSGGVTYIAEAPPGSDPTAAVWRCQSIDSSGNVLWANGDANFDNIPGAAGAGLSGLTYS